MASKNKADVLAAMAGWCDYRGGNPFAGADSPHAVDRCSEFLSNASSILSVLAAAHEDAGFLLNQGSQSAFDNRASTIMAGALKGVGNLIDLAAFLMGDK